MKTVNCLYDADSIAKYVLLHNGEAIRFMYHRDLYRFCDKCFGRDQYRCVFCYADEV